MRRTEIAGIVLAGGASRRFGQDKRGLRLDGQTLLERTLVAVGRVSRNIRVLGAPPRQPFHILQESDSLRWHSDRHPGSGPFCALAGVISQVEEEWMVLCAIDYPYSAQMISVLLASARYENREDVCGWIPHSGEHYHYLCGLYQTRLWRNAPQAVDEGERSIKRYLEPWLKSGAIRTISLAGIARMASNVNTPADWAAVRDRFDHETKLSIHNDQVQP